jgi:hypothetical protein
MPWDDVNWSYVALLSAISFVATLIANLAAARSRILSPIFSALLFAAMFIFVTYYPHGASLPTLKLGDATASKPSQ